MPRAVHTLQEVRQTSPPFLEEGRAEFIFRKSQSQKRRSGEDDKAHRKGFSVATVA